MALADAACTAGQDEVLPVTTGGMAAAKALEALGVTTVFGVPSQHNLGLYDALARHSAIRIVGARHEAGAVHAADGYARATGRLGVAIVSTGPGTANAVNGLYEAGFASSRVMLITTQIDSAYLGAGKGYLHDAEGQMAMLQSVARVVRRPRHAEQIGQTIIEVAHDILTGRPQPGVVEIANDLLFATTATPILNVPPPVTIQPDPASLDRLVERVAAARRPLLWVGGGAVTSGDAGAVRALAEHLGMAVVASPNGRSAMATDHPLFVGSATHLPDFQRLLDASDLVLAIGTRFQAVASWFWSLDLGGKLAHVDIDAAMINRNYPAAVGVVGDAATVMQALIARVPARSVPDSDYLTLAAQVRQAIDAEFADRMGPDHAAFSDAIDRHLPDDRNIVGDATMAANSWGAYRLPVRTFRGFTYSTSLAIGPALPLGIGAAIGSGRKTVIIHGDGGVMLSLGEMAMAVEAGAPIILLIFNDGGYGVLRTLQNMRGVPNVAVDLPPPDFVAIGRAMGLVSEKVASAEAFDQAFARAVACSGPCLIEIALTGLVAPRL